MKFALCATALLGIAAMIVPAVYADCGLAIGRTIRNADKPNPRAIMRRADLSSLPPGCDKAETVAVTLPSGKFKVFKKTPGIMNHFHGESPSDGSSFEYIRGPDGSVFGSIVELEEEAVYQISANADGLPFVTVTNSSDFVDQAPEGERRRLLRGPMADSLDLPQLDQVPPSHRGLSDNGDVLDVMVLWTAKAECRNSGLSAGCTLTATTTANMVGRISLAIQETNTAYDLSGVNTQLNLVHAYYEPNYTEASTDAFGTALSQMRSSSDGIIDNVRTEIVCCCSYWSFHSHSTTLSWFVLSGPREENSVWCRFGCHDHRRPPVLRHCLSRPSRRSHVQRHRVELRHGILLVRP